MHNNEKIIRELYAAGEGQALDTAKFVSMFSDEGYMLDMASGTKFRGKTPALGTKSPKPPNHTMNDAGIITL